MGLLRRRTRGRAGWVRIAAALGAVVAAGCGSGGGAPTGAPASPTVVSDPTPSSTGRGERSAARWETVATFTGTGSQQTAEHTILPGAIQWRVRWSCEGPGALRITTTPPPRRPAPIAEGSCPSKGEGFAIHTGAIRLGVEATGGWRAVVDQQVDTLLDEALLPGMAAAPVVGQGSFYNLEKDGSGTARLYRLADGRRVLRLESFRTAENTDLFVWLSEAARPQNSAEAVNTDHVVLGNLKSTLGNQNYEVPAGVATERIRSVVIWCQPVAIAYTAAALSR